MMHIKVAVLKFCVSFVVGGIPDNGSLLEPKLVACGNTPKGSDCV
jgi:hypothetical protein